VAGAVWLRPKVQRTNFGSDLIPVGFVPRTVNVNVDYAPPALGGWAGSLQMTSLSSRTIANDGSFGLEPLTTLNVGVRYRFKAYERACSVRLDVANATDERGATVTSVFWIVPTLQRNYALTLAIDF
jgi:hypothetical protein